MAASSIYRGRSLRSRRLRGRYENAEENVTLDYSKGVDENLKDILVNICRKDGITKAKKLGYFNAFVRFHHRFHAQYSNNYSKNELLCCLRVGLLHEDKEMRAACLRALRYSIQEKEDVVLLVKQHIDYLLARCLDICIDNEIERIHAARLLRKMIQINPESFPSSLVYVLVSIATDGATERDKMHRTCLATLCELVFANPGVVCECGGVIALLKNVLDTPQLPRINESLLVPILYLLNHPRSRHYIKQDIDLEQLLAPFTDCHFRLEPELTGHHYGEEKELRFAASKMAISTLMRSWPGLIRLCKPDSSGLQSLLGVLYLEDKEARKEILDVLFDLFRLPLPVWTSNFREALASVDPSEMQDSWRLIEGFVAEEGKALLPHLAKTRPNLVENHMALILSSFISAGMFEILVEVITSSSDSATSVRACILLGELLHMANSLLPYECSHHTHCLPTLISMATSFSVSSEKRNRASHAINWLERLHCQKKKGPEPCSMFLRQIIQLAKSSRQETTRSSLRPSSDKLRQYFDRDDNDMLNTAVRDSQVLHTKDNSLWNWEVISAILQWPDDTFMKLEEQAVTRFIRRVVFFLKPSNKIFPVCELSSKHSARMADVGCRLVDFLLASENEDAMKFLEELLADINSCLSRVKDQYMNPDELFSTLKVQTTCAQYYFLFLGRVSAATKGEKLLQETGIFQSMLDIMTSTTQDIYVKLIVSSLDYARDGYARVILNKALAATQESAKLYTTSLMRVLLRARVPFLSNWGMEMLVLQLYDPSRPVAMEALTVITEACEDEVNLHTLVNMRPSVLHLGYKGALLLARFMSIPAGFRFLSDANYINTELKRWHEAPSSIEHLPSEDDYLSIQLRQWHESFNLKYVQIVEERLNEALTTYERTYDGSYIRRSNRRMARKDVFLPVHLYSQLVQHLLGFQLLAKQDYLQEYFDIIRHQPLHTDEEITKLKAALWVTGHIGRSVWGIGLLEEELIIPEIIKLAEECGVFSIRGTSYYVLGLIASTRKGAGLLNHFGWESTRHSRKDQWPVTEEQDLAGGPDDASEETQGLITSLSMASLASAARSDTSSSRARLNSIGLHKQGSLDEYHHHHVPITPDFPSSPNSDYSSSPRAMFFIPKSRSNTMESADVFLHPPRSRSNTAASSVGDEARSRSGTVGSGASSAGKSDVGHMADVDESSSGDKKEKSLLVVDNRTKEESESSQSGSQYDNVTEPGSSSQFSYLENGDRLNGGLNFKQRSVSAPENQAEETFSHARSKSEPVDPENSVHFKEDPESVKRISSSEAMSKKMFKDQLKRKRTNTTESDSGRSDYHSVKSRSTSFGDPVLDKSRSSSVNTDGTTSGISSFESGPHVTIDYPKLSPIPSASSLSTIPTRQISDVSQISEEDEEEKDSKAKTTVHPSDQIRRMVNLKRVPTTKRRYSNPVLGPLSKSLGHNQDLTEEYTLLYTSVKDAHGYAALREIQKQRTFSLDMDDTSMAVITEEPTIGGYKTQSLADFSHRRTGSRTMSFTSLPEATDHSEGGTLPRVSSSSLLAGIKRPTPKTSLGKAEFIGLCLPVDVNMIFQENEGEDKRSFCEPQMLHEEDNFYSAKIKRMAARSVSQCEEDDEEMDDGLEIHHPAMCLACHKILKQDDTEDVDSGAAATVAVTGDGEIFLPCSSDPMSPNSSPPPSPSLPLARVHRRLQRDSVTSNISNPDSGTLRPGAVMGDDSPVGKALVRKEILKLVTNLSSSIGTKSAEKGLLILKQKYPNAFDDLCLYSEICYLLANYGFRLNGRRFIQELFQDATFTQLYEEPLQLLHIPDTPCSTQPADLNSRLEQVPESHA